MGTNDDDRTAYSIRMVQKEEDMNQYAYDFMSFACNCIDEFDDDDKPIIMMGIINALTSLIEDKEDYDFSVEASKACITQMMMLSLNPQDMAS